ncbi:UNVERIFIED_CONTAM: hypothetical protein HDU68_004727 [Siphonaria sp. JEL0065]|nr:hypothetical protein HDU68_004727 [Siphonaria sp. JEL0065]
MGGPSGSCVLGGNLVPNTGLTAPAGGAGGGIAVIAARSVLGYGCIQANRQNEKDGYLIFNAMPATTKPASMIGGYGGSGGVAVLMTQQVAPATVTVQAIEGQMGATVNTLPVSTPGVVEYTFIWNPLAYLASGSVLLPLLARM